jgi:ABC-type multidrug transport system ATPase subunit
MHSDRILILDKGKIIHFDKSSVLSDKKALEGLEFDLK